MLKLRMDLTAAALLLVSVVLAWNSLPVHEDDSETLLVFAAASLTDAFTELAEAFEAAHPGVTVTLNFASSATLAVQIVEGAPADVFASANEQQMAVVAAAGRVAGEVQPFAQNRLAVLLPEENRAGLQTLHDLAKPGVLLVIAAPETPIRTYTDDLLARLADDPAYGRDYRDALLANVVSEEANVRQVAAKVVLGEADAGIVYRSDMTPDMAGTVITLPIPEAINPVATYPAARMQASQNPALAGQFIAFLRSEAGQSIMARWGFNPVS